MSCSCGLTPGRVCGLPIRAVLGRVFVLPLERRPPTGRSTFVRLETVAAYLHTLPCRTTQQAAANDPQG